MIRGALRTLFQEQGWGKRGGREKMMESIYCLPTGWGGTKKICGSGSADSHILFRPILSINRAGRGIA